MLVPADDTSATYPRAWARLPHARWHLSPLGWNIFWILLIKVVVLMAIKITFFSGDRRVSVTPERLQQQFFSTTMTDIAPISGETTVQ